MTETVHNVLPDNVQSGGRVKVLYIIKLNSRVSVIVPKYLPLSLILCSLKVLHAAGNVLFSFRWNVGPEVWVCFGALR